MLESERLFDDVDKFLKGHEDEDNDIAFPIQLPPSTILEIRNWLRREIALDRIGKIFHLDMKNKGITEFQKEQVIMDPRVEILHTSFEEALDQLGENDSDQVSSESLINLSANDIDFLNRYLDPIQEEPQDHPLHDSSNFPGLGKVSINSDDDQFILDLMDDVQLQEDINKIKTYTSLNKAFIKAGGEPRPKFLEYYEGDVSDLK